MDDNRTAYLKEQIEFLKSEMSRSVDDSQPMGAAMHERHRAEMHAKILELMDRLADPQREEREARERQNYRELLERISADDKALQAAKNVAGECDDEETRQAIICDAVAIYEKTKLEIAKILAEKLA